MGGNVAKKKSHNYQTDDTIRDPTIEVIQFHKYFNDRLLGLAVIFSWGYGDALAALIGTKFGKHKIYKKKSLEGTLAMFITSLITILVILFIRGMIPWYGIVVTAVITSLVVSIVELFTPNGLDTVTCPLASMVVMILLLMLFGGF